MNVCVIIPTYNEASNIRTLVMRIRELSTPYAVLIIDDNSPDGTRQEVEQLQSAYANIHLLNRPCKKGIASAYQEGFVWCFDNGYDAVIQMDADLSHDPAMIPLFIKELCATDLVVGSRYVNNGGILNWYIGRLLLSRMANLYAKLLLRVPFYDLTSGYKCLRRSTLALLIKNPLQSKGYSFQIEMIYKCFKNQCRIHEIPIIFKGRRHEKSKMSLEIIFEAFFRVIGLSMYNMYDFICNGFKSLFANIIGDLKSG